MFWVLKNEQEFSGQRSDSQKQEDIKEHGLIDVLWQEHDMNRNEEHEMKLEIFHLNMMSSLGEGDRSDWVTPLA